MSIRIEQDGDDTLIWIKAVPGSSRDEIVGLHGDRLKVRISAPAEGGKANQAICKVLAGALGVRAKEVVIDGGLTNSEKRVRIKGRQAEAVLARLG